MGMVASLGILGIVVAFLVGVLSGFPTLDMPLPGPASAQDEAYSVEAVHQAAGLFAGSYMSLVNEIASFQQDPDYERAELRRQQMVAYGQSLMPRLQGLEQQLQGEAQRLGTPTPGQP